MRAAAPSAPSSAAGPLALVDAKVAGNGAGAAAQEASSTGAASDRSADSSQEGTSGQRFAAALASAQADTDLNSGTQAVSVRSAIEGADDPKTLRLPPVARLDSRMQAGSATGARALKTDTEPPSIISSAAADSTTDSADATEGSPAAVDADAGAPATPPTAGSKPRAGKHSQTAPVLDGAALATLAATLGTAAAQTSAAAAASTAAAAASETASPAPRSSGNGADAGSAVAALSVAAKQPQPRVFAAEVTATSSSSIGPSTADRSATGGDTNGASAEALAAARTADAGASSAATGTGLAPVMQGLSAVTNAPAASATASVHVPVADPSWPNALAAQVQWMATRQVQSATLRLSPAHLGPLEVRINVTSSQINVNFTAHHPDTREALAQAVPQLRQLFAAGGLNLGEATVRQQPGSSGQTPQPQPSSAAARSETVEPVANTAIQRLGLVDEYA